MWSRTTVHTGLLAILVLASGSAGQVQDSGYDPAPSGTGHLTSRLGLTMRVLVDSASLGGVELSMVEMTLPAGEPLVASEHLHGTIELFYILEGELEHVVGGQPHRLGPGNVGILRPGDLVRHRVVSEEPVRALVVWVPGTELERIRPAMIARELPVARTAASDAAGLARLREQWSEAYEAGDSAALDGLYTPDVVRMPYDAPAQVGKTAVMTGYAATFRQRRLTPDIELVAAELHITPTLAVERGAYHEVLTGPDGTVRFTEDGTYMSVIRRDAGGVWRYEWSMFNRDARPAGAGQ